MLRMTKKAVPTVSSKEILQEPAAEAMHSFAMTALYEREMKPVVMD